MDKENNPDQQVATSGHGTNKPHLSVKGCESNKSVGVNGLVKTLYKDDKYGGKYGQDLERAINRFRTMTNMSKV